MYFAVDANLSIFDSDAIQVCVFPVSFYDSAISAQCKPWVASKCTATGCYQPITGSQLTFGEATCKPRLRHGHLQDVHTSVCGSESHSCLRPSACCNRLYIMTRCCLVTRIGGTYWTLTRQCILSKPWCQSTRLHGVLIQKTVLCMSTDVKTQNVMFFITFMVQ